MCCTVIFIDYDIRVQLTSLRWFLNAVESDFACAAISRAAIVVKRISDRSSVFFSRFFKIEFQFCIRRSVNKHFKYDLCFPSIIASII